MARSSFLSLLSLLLSFGTEIPNCFASVQPPERAAALRMCATMPILERQCTLASFESDFTGDSLRVCGDMKYDSAIVRCLQIEADDSVDVDLLKACDEEQSDWRTLDCLKRVSNKSGAQLHNWVWVDAGQTAVVANSPSPTEAWEAVARQVKEKQLANTCFGFRAIVPSSADWRNKDCWSSNTVYEYATGPAVPPADRLEMGQGALNHCVVGLSCVTD